MSLSVSEAVEAVRATLVSMPPGSQVTVSLGPDPLLPIRLRARQEIERLRGEGLSWARVKQSAIWDVYVLAGGR